MDGNEIAAFSTVTKAPADGVVDVPIIARGCREEIVLSGDNPDDMVVAVSASQPPAVLIGNRRIVEQTRVLPVRLDRIAPGDDRRDIEAILRGLLDDRIDVAEEELVRLGRVGVSLPMIIVSFIMREKRALDDVETLSGARAQIQIHAIGGYSLQPPRCVACPEEGERVLPLDATPVIGHLQRGQALCLRPNRQDNSKQDEHVTHQLFHLMSACRAASDPAAV